MDSLFAYDLFLKEVRKSRVGSVPPDVFLTFINKAQKDVVDNKLAIKEGNSRHLRDLIPIHMRSPLLTKVNDVDSDCFSLPSDYLDLNSILLELIKDNITIKNVTVSILRDNRISEVLSSPYDRPSFRKCYYSFENVDSKKAIRLYMPDSFTPSIRLMYYKNPDKIDFTYNNNIPVGKPIAWSESMLGEIVSKAVVTYLESIGDQRLGSKISIENQNNKNI